MAAAVMTPSLVQKSEYTVFNQVTGSPVQFTEYYIEVTKVTQADWILLEAAIGDTTKELASASGIVLDSSSDMTQETLTYDDSADKLVLAGAAVGTVKLTIRMENA